MSVSRTVVYSWRCARCGGVQEASVWRIVDAREHSDVIERGGPGLAGAACPACGYPAEINEPLLVIRPGDPLPLLLGLPLVQVGDPEVPSRELAIEAARSLGDISGIPGPMVPLSRPLIAVALARNPSDDAADAEKAANEAFGTDAANAALYHAFLQRVRSVELERKVASSLQGLWSVPPQELAEFLADNPELGSSFAVARARWELVEHPDDGRDVFEARLAVVEGLAANARPDDVAREYLAAIERLAARGNDEPSSLLADVDANQGPAGIPYLRR